MRNIRNIDLQQPTIFILDHTNCIIKVLRVIPIDRHDRLICKICSTFQLLRLHFLLYLHCLIHDFFWELWFNVMIQKNRKDIYTWIILMTNHTFKFQSQKMNSVLYDLALQLKPFYSRKIMRCNQLDLLIAKLLIIWHKCWSHTSHDRTDHLCMRSYKYLYDLTIHLPLLTTIQYRIAIQSICLITLIELHNRTIFIVYETHTLRIHRQLTSI